MKQFFKKLWVQPKTICLIKWKIRKQQCVSRGPSLTPPQWKKPQEVTTPVTLQVCAFYSKGFNTFIRGLNSRLSDGGGPLRRAAL